MHVDNAQAVAGTILRVTQGRVIGELRVTEMTAPDAGLPPFPTCLTRHARSERAIDFDLNWAGINFGELGPAPAVRLTITALNGRPMVAEIPQAVPPNHCRVVQSLLLTSESRGEQLVYGMTLRQPTDTRPSGLSVTVDGHAIKIRLSPVCIRSNCFQNDPPVPWVWGTPYSTSLSI